MQQDYETDHDGATRGQQVGRAPVLMVVSRNPQPQSLMNKPNPQE